MWNPHAKNTKIINAENFRLKLNNGLMERKEHNGIKFIYKWSKKPVLLFFFKWN